MNLRRWLALITVILDGSLLVSEYLSGKPGYAIVFAVFMVITLMVISLAPGGK